MDRIAKLVRALKNSDMNVRKQAAIELGELKNTRAVIPLLRTLNMDESPEVRRTAIETLAKIGDVRAVDTMAYTYLGKGPSERSDCPYMDLREATEADKQFVARFILEIGPAAIDVLIDIVEKKGGQYYPANAIIRWQVALLALWKSSDPRAQETVARLLHHEDKHVRWHFSRFLGKHEESRATDFLIALCDDDDPEVRQVTVAAISERTGNEVIKALFRAMLDEVTDVRKAAEEALNKWHSFGSGI